MDAEEGFTILMLAERPRLVIVGSRLHVKSGWRAG